MRKEKDYVNLVKGIGKFYNVYNDDAIIISYLMGYKVRENKTCGFPDNALNKVINKLEDKKISYIVTMSRKSIDNIKSGIKRNKYLYENEYIDEAEYFASMMNYKKAYPFTSNKKNEDIISYLG